MNVKLHNGKQVPKLDSHERKMVRAVANLLGLHMAVSPDPQPVGTLPTVDRRAVAKVTLEAMIAEDVADPDAKSE